MLRRMTPVLTIIGPSGTGKSSVARELDRRGLLRVQPTWTTRPRRRDETSGALEHRFVTETVFDELVGADFFVGVVQLPGLPFRYGLPRVAPATGGRITTVLARAPFIAPLAEQVPQLLVYQINDTRERAEARIVARGSSTADVAARIAEHDRETQLGHQLASRVFVNRGRLDELVDDVALALHIDCVGAVR
jgi:guanylate kinase